MRQLAACLVLLALQCMVRAYELPRLTTVSLASPATVSPGDTLILRYRFAAGSAPTGSISFSFTGPLGTTRTLTGDSLQGALSIAVTSDWLNGSYQLTEAVANTMYNRLISFRADGSSTTAPPVAPVASGTTPALSAVRFTVTGATDTYRAPVLTALTRSNPGTLSPGDSATFSCTVTPGSAPLTNLRVRLRDSGLRTINLNLTLTTPTTATGVLAPASDWLNGTHTVESVQAFDAAGNVVTYSRSGAIANAFGSGGSHALNLPSLDVVVANATTTFVAPRLTFLGLNFSPPVRAGDNAGIAFAVTPGTSPIASVTFTFFSTGSVNETVSVTTLTPASGLAALRVPHDLFVPNKCQLSNVSVVDRLGRTTSYDRNGDLTAFGSPRVSHAFDFSTLDFNVVAPLAGRLANLAIRSTAGTGAQTLIVGFTVGGAGASGTKPLLVRGVGPSLGLLGVGGTLADPVLAIYSGQNKILENDNWGGDGPIVTAAGSVGAFALSAGSTDAALMMSAGVAGYSAQITGKNNASGIALAEIYDTTSAAALSAGGPRLVNLSTRTQVGTGGEILIAGFTIADGPRTVLLRAIGGTSLGQFGVSGTLANPKLTLFAGSEPIAANDDWSGDLALASAFIATGAFGLATDSGDAAVVATLPPGSYTAQVNGVNGSTGVALVEVYEIP